VQVRLPIEVQGTDRNGARFAEHTVSENVCRSGLAFALAHDIDVGVELELIIPLPRQRRRQATDFSTRGRVCYVKTSAAGALIGVQFTGPRFHHVFLSESAEG
jgi:hypothetical protein